MNFNIDALMEELFTPEEREELLVQRIHNLISESAAQLLEDLFTHYREEQNISFLEGDFETKEEFAAEYLDKLIKSFPNSFRLACDWPAANCNMTVIIRILGSQHCINIIIQKDIDFFGIQEVLLIVPLWMMQ